MLKLSKDKKERIILLLQSYYYDERDEELGIIGAENLYQFIEDEVAPIIYNQAIKDAKGVMDQQWLRMEEELYVLKHKLS